MAAVDTNLVAIRISTLNSWVQCSTFVPAWISDTAIPIACQASRVVRDRDHHGISCRSPEGVGANLTKGKRSFFGVSLRDRVHDHDRPEAEAFVKGFRPVRIAAVTHNVTGLRCDRRSSI